MSDNIFNISEKSDEQIISVISQCKDELKKRLEFYNKKIKEAELSKENLKKYFNESN